MPQIEECDSCRGSGLEPCGAECCGACSSCAGCGSICWGCGAGEDYCWCELEEMEESLERLDAIIIKSMGERLERQTEYSIALQRMIEGLARDGRVPVETKQSAPHLYEVALRIEARLEALEKLVDMWQQEAAVRDAGYPID